jgi:hypothetical protein
MAADPRYDLSGALAALMPGLVVQRELIDAAAARYAANGFAPLGGADVAPILAAVNTTDVVVLAIPSASSDSKATTRAVYPAAPPAFPTSLKRFADSNPDPIDGFVEFGRT